MSIFGNRLEQMRKESGWTKTYVAQRLKLPLSTYANYEYGQREPDIDTITAISTLFDTSNDYLMGKTNDPTPVDSKNNSEKDDTALTWKDLGMAYGGEIPEELKETYADIAKGYFKRHPEFLNKNNK